MLLVLDRLAEDAAGFFALECRLDLSRVAIAGHSNGGIAAVEACAIDARLLACMNIDGQAAAARSRRDRTLWRRRNPPCTSPRRCSATNRLPALFEDAGHDTYRVQVPAATHGTFADGPRFRPRLVPIDGIAHAVLTIERGFALAFFDRALRGAPQTVFRAVTAPTDVVVEVYPLGDRSRAREPLP